MLPSLSTATVMFSGLVCVGMLTAFGRSTFTVLLMTGIVTRKMMSSTNMTSTSGVVLMFAITPCSSPEPPTFIAILNSSHVSGGPVEGSPDTVPLFLGDYRQATYGWRQQVLPPAGPPPTRSRQRRRRLPDSHATRPPR